MPDPNLFRLRVTFCEQSRLALLSHLELARALERAVRRAGLPFAVSSCAKISSNTFVTLSGL